LSRSALAVGRRTARISRPSRSPRRREAIQHGARRSHFDAEIAARLPRSRGVGWRRSGMRGCDHRRRFGTGLRASRSLGCGPRGEPPATVRDGSSSLDLARVSDGEIPPCAGRLARIASPRYANIRETATAVCAVCSGPRWEGKRRRSSCGGRKPRMALGYRLTQSTYANHGTSDYCRRGPGRLMPQSDATIARNARETGFLSSHHSPSTKSCESGSKRNSPLR
jgi:hypothetical protein